MASEKDGGEKAGFKRELIDSLPVGYVEDGRKWSSGNDLRSFSKKRSNGAREIAIFLLSSRRRHRSVDVKMGRKRSSFPIPNNVHLKKWVPQPSLLSGKRIKVFVTHGGLGSIMEVAYSGKPALVIPIFGDQHHNAAMLERHGGAVAYNKFDLQDGDKLARVISEMVGNDQYEKNAEMLLKVLRNQPSDPKEEFLTKLGFALNHVKFISKLADIIADYGHDVTLFQPFHTAMKNLDGLVKNKNIEIINYYPDHYEELEKEETQTFPIFWDSNLMNNPILAAFMLPTVLGGSFKKTAIQVVKNQSIIDELKEKNFDVMMAETFELTGHYLSHLLEIPCISFMSTVRYPLMNQQFGQASLLGHVPQLGSKMGPDAGFLDRLNDFYRLFFMSIAQERLNKYQHDFMEEAIGRPVPFWKELVKSSPIYITNSNPYLDFAVPSTANIVHAGGITMDLETLTRKTALPDEYEQILKERDSTVLISFGSVIRSYEMPETFRSGIIKMFENLPNITFIWKYEKDDVELQKRLPNNVHLKKWVPQPSLLSDKRIKVFVTHGGLGSIMEVAYSGKPALVIPIFGDQHHNAAMLERHGGAVAYNKFDLQDGDKLARVISEMVGNDQYEKNAHELLKVLHNQPIDPKQNLMNHLEFAIKFPNHHSLVPMHNEQGIVAHYYLDVILFLFASFAVVSYVSIIVIRRIHIKLMAVRKSKKD